MDLDPAYVSQNLQYTDDSNVCHKRKPCFEWLSDDENSPERPDITKKNVQWVLDTGGNAADSRSVKSLRKVMFSDDKQVHGSHDIKSRMGKIYSYETNSRIGRKCFGHMNNRIGRRHSDKMTCRVSRVYSDNMETRLCRSPSDNIKKTVGRIYSDDMNVTMARIHYDERNIKKDRKHSSPHAEKYSSYSERASPFSLRACQRRGPEMKNRNKIKNNHKQLLEQGIYYNLRSNLHEWHYRQDKQLCSIKDKRIIYNRRYSADIGHEREKQTATEEPLKSHKKSRCHVKEIARLRNRDDMLRSFSGRKNIDNLQNFKK